MRLRITTNAMRTIDKRGGLDAFLLSSADADLPRPLVRLKRRIAAAREARADS